jgi:hypothetical protein
MSATDALASSSVAGDCFDCVSAGQSTESYNGALLIPAGSNASPAGVSAVAAHCSGCEWLVQPDCRDTSGTGDAICPGAIGTCPPGEIRILLRLRRPGEPIYQPVGTFCRGPGQALTPEALVPGVRDQFLKYLPTMHPSFQPAGRGIVNIPVLFATGQPATIGRPAFALGGFRVELEAHASWRWDFGDGTSGVFTVPGGGWPDTSVAHTYLAQADCQVRVTATWVGQFWVDGAGPFEVTGPDITQAAPLLVPVKEARAVLVG